MSQIKKTFTTHKYTVTYSVEEEDDGIRLDSFIQKHLENFSRQFIKKKIKEGEVVISDRPHPHRPSTKVHEGDTVTLTTTRSNQEDEYWNGEKIELSEIPEIVFQDDDLIVASKPPFMSTHPTGRHLFYCATVYFEHLHGGTMHSVHRLDRETSGVLLLARNPKTAQILTDEFFHDNVKKCYFFISKIDSAYKGEKRFEANERMGSPKTGLKRVLVSAYPENTSEGKHARTLFSVLHEEKGYALGVAFPQTGRQHQIRVHAKAHGLPLVGDKIYLGGYEMFQRFKDDLASKEDHDLMELPRHALHAIALNVSYKGKREIFLSHIPHDFKTWIEEKLTIRIDDLEKKVKEEINSYFQSI